MKLIFNFGVIVFVFSCVFGCSSFGYQSPRYVKLAHEITEKSAKKLKAQKNLVLIGTGGQMMHDIQMMAMSFHFYQEVDLRTGRELIIYAINEYLSAINSNEEVRPYLNNYPFTPKNIEIRIWIYKPDRTHASLDKIYYISALNGILTYYLDLPETYSRQAICEETYEEAERAVSFQ